MIGVSGFYGLRAASPLLLAILIGCVILLALLTPMFLKARSPSERLRRVMIEQHRVKLRAARLRRDRPGQIDAQRSRRARLSTIFSFIPVRKRVDHERLLRSAGYHGPLATTVFWTSKCVLSLTATVLLIGHFAFFPDAVEQSAIGIGALFMPVIIFFLPDYIVKRQRKMRLLRLSRSLPDGLDLLVICAEAGLSLDAALKRVADEFITVVPELSEELLLTSVELSFLPNRRQALANLGSRVELPAFRGVVATLIQSEKYGTPLAQALRALASEFRDHRLLTAEEKAARLPAILTVPMIVFILPALFIVLAGPAFIQVSEKFFSG
jgi:tight adherence protein C